MSVTLQLLFLILLPNALYAGLRWDTKRIIVDDIALNAWGAATFVAHNDGDVTIVVTNFAPSCECVETTESALIIAPHRTAAVTFRARLVRDSREAFVISYRTDPDGTVDMLEFQLTSPTHVELDPAALRWRRSDFAAQVFRITASKRRRIVSVRLANPGCGLEVVTTKLIENRAEISVCPARRALPSAMAKFAVILDTGDIKIVPLASLFEEDMRSE